MQGFDLVSDLTVVLLQFLCFRQLAHLLQLELVLLLDALDPAAVDFRKEMIMPLSK